LTDDNNRTIRRTMVKYGVGLSFVACLATLTAYLIHGWVWNSKFAGGRITLSVPEFVALVVLVTLALGVIIGVYRRKR
jgi:hypothetical protein